MWWHQEGAKHNQDQYQIGDNEGKNVIIRISTELKSDIGVTVDLAIEKVAVDEANVLRSSFVDP